MAAGALGGVVADVDTVDNDYKADALIGQLLAVLIVGICIGTDCFLHIGVIQYIIEHIIEHKILSIAGGVFYIGLYVKGFLSDHRTFTYSLLAMLLFSIAIAMIYPGLAEGFIFGYMSYIVLDLLNKKTVPVFIRLVKGFVLSYAMHRKQVIPLS